MIITEILARNARMYTDEIALVEREPARGSRREITWQEFDQMANLVANALIAGGIKKGDRVILLMMNCLEWLPLYFGILRTGAWAVPLNFRFTAKDIRYCGEISEAKIIIFGEEFIDRMNINERTLEGATGYIFVGPDNSRPDYAVSLNNFLRGASEKDPSIPLTILDDAALYFTSGTTGTPKPILLTHRNLEASGIVDNMAHKQVHKDIFLTIPPLYHTGAKINCFGSFIVGGRVVILKGVKPGWIIEAVSQEQITIAFLLVPWAQDILVAIENGEIKLEDHKLDQWRLMHIGAQPVPPSLIKKWKTLFPNQDYDTTYGLSECTGPGCINLGIENSHKVGAIGKPGFDWEARVVDGGLNDVPRGHTGEIMVKGPGVMKEYYKNPKATHETIKDGWLLTGDIARIDEDGFIWIVDRKKDVIISGGENVFPIEVENFLMENKKVQDAGVIGIPDERLGEIVAAVVQTKPGVVMTEEEMLDYCESLPRYKRPKKIFFGDVPRNPTGKIEKPRLRETYSGTRESFKL
ncbi:class I adenylate-forming enzyme family protein [Thermodesulfobacteriota bacterium]